MTKATLVLDSLLFNQPVFRARLRTLVTKAALGVEAEAKRRILQGPKTGRTYPRRQIVKVVGATRAQAFSAMGLRRAPGAKGFVVGFGFHRASAPGQSPASDTGNLANSIVALPAQSDALGIRAFIQINANYARELEEGGGRIAARPYMAPAVKKVQPQFIASVNELLAVAVR